MEYLSPEELDGLKPARQALASPIPTQPISNGEFWPARQNAVQARLEARILALADDLSSRAGLDRRRFLATPAGMAAAFVAMNEIYGRIFDVDAAEAATPGLAQARADALSSQFIFDVHTHFLREDAGPGLQYFATLRENTARKGYNPELGGRTQTRDDLHLGTYLREMWFDSDTKLATLSGAPSDITHDWLLSNEAIAEARAQVNRFAGTKRLFSHFIFTPGQPGWLDAIDHGVAVLKPDAWKGYTIGDNTHKEISRYPWLMDDEKVAYKGYEKFEKAGIRNVAIHKGLFTQSDQARFAWLMRYAKADDVGKAAKDWPGLNFLIYHAAYRYTGEGEPKIADGEFEKSGRMEWVSDLADVPAKYGVTNVYADVGASFAACCIAEPRTAAAMMGILIKGLGADRVLWGTDSIWFGSPQWQIEALRRLEIPEDMQRRFGFAPLGPPDGAVKRGIFGENAARLFPEAHAVRWTGIDDRLSQRKRDYAASGALRSNQAYGWVRA